MAQIILKRGLSKDLSLEPLKDGLLSFTTDDGKIHLDYIDGQGELKRKTFYGGKLTIGQKIYDGSEDVEITVYEGLIAD